MYYLLIQLIINIWSKPIYYIILLFVYYIIIYKSVRCKWYSKPEHSNKKSFFGYSIVIVLFAHASCPSQSTKFTCIPCIFVFLHDWIPWQSIDKPLPLNGSPIACILCTPYTPWFPWTLNS